MTSTMTSSTVPTAMPGGTTLAMFPGQGSQRAGMAAHLLEHHPTVAEPIFRAADAAAGFELTRLCVSGGKGDLTRTDITQPAVLATSLATWEILRAEGFRPRAVAGHSLGEFTALVAAGVLSMDSAFALVRRRGELMARVAERTEGGMLAVIGLPAAAVERACAEHTGTGVAEVANYNDADQTVVSGHRAALAEVAGAVRAAGAQKVVLLEVGAPFHCSLMSAAEAEFADELARHNFGPARLPVISSVTGAVLASGADARGLLRRQLACPVRWTEVLAAAERHGATAYLEVGPGRVLTGFAKHTVDNRTVLSTGDARRIDAAIREIRDQEGTLS
ncbi:MULTISPECIES: ACP S-malonyltransferase [unclassified Nocardia]|uniref:ACP S-malonyltransferase n=2 Tax=Nocardia TaxID=1817 RepID=UPI00278BB35A|nr:MULTISPECIES: ACP S-malonyltransferase [unclassified Nocardia]